MQDRQADVPHLCLPLIQTNIQGKNIKPTRTENRLNSRNIAIAQGVQETNNSDSRRFVDLAVYEGWYNGCCRRRRVVKCSSDSQQAVASTRYARPHSVMEFHIREPASAAEARISGGSRKSC